MLLAWKRRFCCECLKMSHQTRMENNRFWPNVQVLSVCLSIIYLILITNIIESFQQLESINILSHSFVRSSGMLGALARLEKPCFIPIELPVPPQKKFCDPVVIESIYHRTRTNRLKNESKTTGCRKKKFGRVWIASHSRTWIELDRGSQPPIDSKMAIFRHKNCTVKRGNADFCFWR